MSFIRHIHNYTEYNQQWNVFSAFNPSKCTHSWSSGQPTLRRPGNSWGFSAFLKGLTSVVDNSCRSRDSNPQPRITSPTLYPLKPWLSPVCIYIYIYIQWGKKVFSQPPIVQVLPLKKMREACNFHHRYTSTMRDKIRKNIQKITL